MADIISRRANLSIEDFWRKTGLENINTFKEHHPEYFKKVYFLFRPTWISYIGSSLIN